MFRYMAWALSLESIPPLTRLMAIYLAEHFSFTDTVLTRTRIDRAQAWVGCSGDELLNAFFHLANYGFTELRAADNWFEWEFPELPEDDRPAPPQLPQKQRTIYVISAGEGISKIGIAYNPQQRLAGLQAANPQQKLALVFTETRPASVIHAAERRAHQALAAHAIGNEWFRVCQEVAIEAVKVALGESK